MPAVLLYTMLALEAMISPSLATLALTQAPLIQAPLSQAPLLSTIGPTVDLLLLLHRTVIGPTVDPVNPLHRTVEETVQANTEAVQAPAPAEVKIKDIAAAHIRALQAGTASTDVV